MQRSLALAAAVAVVACNRVEGVTIGTATVTKRMAPSNDLDILFVIDNSASTSDKQAVFASNFPTFASALDAFPGGRPSVHVGVVSSSVSIGNASFGPNCATGDDGLLQNTACTARGTCTTACSTPTDRYISDVVSAGARTTNYTGTLADTLACIGFIGATGCGFEAPLDAMKRALDGSRPDNAGFVRDDAYLAVIVLTDEDDCSVADPALFALPASESGPGDFRCQPLYAYDCDHPISATDASTYTSCKVKHGGYLHDPGDYTQFLASIKHPSQTVVAVVAGDPSPQIQTGAVTAPFSQSLALQPSCTATINGNFAIARPALRLAELVAQFGDHGVFETVCQSDYSGALTAIGRTLFAMMSPCLEGNLATADRDAVNPGLQPACVVTERDGFASAAERDVQLPACAMTDAVTPELGGVRPCWWVASEPACGATPTGLALHVERLAPAPAGSVVDATCELQ